MKLILALAALAALAPLASAQNDPGTVNRASAPPPPIEGAGRGGLPLVAARAVTLRSLRPACATAEITGFWRLGGAQGRLCRGAPRAALRRGDRRPLAGAG